MKITSLVWNATNTEHIARHHIMPEDVEEMCRHRPLVLTAPARGPHPVCYVLGQTLAGRYLFAVIVYFGQGKGYPVTARDMNEHERRRSLRWKKR